VCNSNDHLARNCKATKAGKVVRAGDNKPTQGTAISFLKTVDSLFPPTEALISQETEEAWTTSNLKSVKTEVPISERIRHSYS